MAGRQGIANGGDGCRDFCGFVRPDNLVGCLTAGGVDSVSVLEPGGGRDFGFWSFIIFGLAGSPVYYSCWELFERFPKMLEWPEWCGEPKNLAELIYGFIFGVMLW